MALAQAELTPPQKRPTIGVLAGWQFYWTATPLSYLNPLFEGISAAARDLDSNLLLACGIGLTASPADPFRPAWPEPSAEADFVPVGPWNTDGLIVINPLHSNSRARYVHNLIAAGHPVLFIGSGEGQPEIIADNAQGIQQAVQHLADHGHHRIAFIAGSQDDLNGDSGIRLQAYQQAVAADHRLTFEPLLVAYGRHVFDGGYEAMRQILASSVAFTAVLASNDESAFGAMQALREAGLRIPEDIAIIGFDDRFESLVQTPPLTSVRIPLYDLGYQALELMVQKVMGEANTKIQRRVSARLMVRRSCGCGQDGEPQSLRQDMPSQSHERLVQAMTQAVHIEARHLSRDEIQTFCHKLVTAFSEGHDAEHWPAFQQAINDISRRCETLDEDVSIWQTAISLLRQELAAGVVPSVPPSPTMELLDRAFINLAQHNQRQARQKTVFQRETLDRTAVPNLENHSALAPTQTSGGELASPAWMTTSASPAY